MADAMGRFQLTSRPRPEQGNPHSFRAVAASFIFHGLLLGSVVGLSFIYHSHLPLITNGSAPGSTVMVLEPMIITSTPPPPPAPSIPPPALPTPTPTVAIAPVPPVQPLATVPVLATPPLEHMLPAPVKTHLVIHTAAMHPATTISLSHPKPAAAAAVSSYAPGASDLPHPPYPMEARDRHETGVVVMNVQFDGNGDVARAVVAQSSGVPILDSETRSFIRAHWHSAVFAGQTISQPVEYSLENL